MSLILQSFLLSIGVAGRMILPLLFITIASVVVWLVVGIFTLGLSSYVSASITTAFITLYGIRMALELKGERSFVDLRSLATYAVAFGIILEVLEKIGLAAAGWIAVVATETRMGNTIRIQDLKTAEESIQFAFALNAVSFYGLFALLVYTAIQTAFAVPMATAARTAGKGAPSGTFLNGFGRNFLTLYLIFLFSFFFQFFFKLYAVIIYLFGRLLVDLTRLLNQMAEAVGSQDRIGLSLFEAFDITAILYSIAALFALLWLQSLVWSAAALALIKQDGIAPTRRQPAQKDAAPAELDLRALRKARENKHA